MAQPEHGSYVHRLGKLFITECKVVHEKGIISDGLDDLFVLKQ